MKAANMQRLCTKQVEAFDVVIVCTSNQSLEDYWQARLEGGVGVVKKTTEICVVHEDWEGGAGNGLGTLYAFQKADKKYKAKLGKSLVADMSNGTVSVALYHTAGKGTRLSPLPGSESNNKPGVKLPGVVSVNGTTECITILESVVKQTGLYASSRKGRLSVFWGDQIFIPTVSTSYTPTHHADILAMLGSFPTAEEWAERGLEKYGLIAVNEEGNACQVEKVTYETASKLLKGMGKMVAVGTSLGSFSVSAQLLHGLLCEFSEELAAKVGKLDTDPHFWMPLTLPQEGYSELMSRKGMSTADASKHWQRMRTFAKKTFKGSPHLFGAVDVGSKPYWWDYGQLQYYVANNMKLTDCGAGAAADTEEAAAMRQFFQVPSTAAAASHVDAASKVAESAELSGGSVVLGSTLGGGRATRCVVVNCNIGHLEAENCILMNVTAPRVVVKGGVIYNASEVDPKALELADGTVAVDIALLKGATQGSGFDAVRIFSHTGTCGGKSWKKKVHSNAHTFEDIYLKNGAADVAAAAKFLASQRAAAAAAIGASACVQIRDAAVTVGTTA